MRYDMTLNNPLNIEKQMDEYKKILESNGFEVKKIDIDNKADVFIVADVQKDSIIFRCSWYAGYMEGVLCYCKKCGSESWAEWVEIDNFDWFEMAKDVKVKYDGDLKKVSSEMKKSINKFKSMSGDRKKNPALAIKNCPCCDANFAREKEFYYMHYLGKVKSKFGKMQAMCKDSDEKEAQKQLNELLSLHVDSYEFENGDLNNDTIRNSTKELIEYVGKLINIESNIYFLKSRLPLLYSQRLDINRKVFGEKYTGLYELKCQLKKAEITYNECLEDYRKCTDIYKPVSVPFRPPVCPSEPVYAVPKLFNKKSVAEANRLLKNQYEAEIEEYHKQIDAYKKNKEKYIQELRNNAEKKMKKAKEVMDNAKTSVDSFKVNTEVTSSTFELKLLIDDEIERAETNLKQFLEVKDKMYMYDIVFSKYRNLVALTTFYEYLKSGRCEQLEGTNGAYNLYESEIRLNMIVSQLSDVIDKLDKIQQSQYMIYSELTSINSKLGALNSKMDSALSSLQNIEYNSNQIVRTNEMIAYNTAVTAHYSKMTAEYTNALGYLVALK